MGRSGNGGGNNKVFGQTMKKSKGGKTSNYQRQFGGGSGSQHSKIASASTDKESEEQQRAERRRLKQAQGEALDVKFGYPSLESTVELGETTERRGWLFHMLPTTVRIV